MSADRPSICLVAAVARGGVIGHKGKMPWHLPEDLAHFKRLTQGSAVIMGRRTWDSLPPRFRPLPGRTNIVVTRNPAWAEPGARPAPNLDAAIGIARAALPQAARIFVIGGAELYAAALPLADELELTEIDASFGGDAHFPAWNRAEFTPTRRERHQAAPPNDFQFEFINYSRKA